MTRVTDGWKPYTLFTVDDVPFDRFPQYADGGPAMVAMNGWSVSTTSGDGIDGVICGAHRRSEPHELDKKPFATRKAATQAQYEAGLLAFMVYDDSKWANA